MVDAMMPIMELPLRSLHIFSSVAQLESADRARRSILLGSCAADSTQHMKQSPE